MSKELTEELKQLITLSYREYGDDKVVVWDNKSYSGNELADEIEQETILGIELLNNVIQLTIDLVKRGKVKRDENRNM
jgi:hypothetical protein